jgi:hypothetical protein
VAGLPQLPLLECSDRAWTKEGGLDCGVVLLLIFLLVIHFLYLVVLVGEALAGT